MNDQDQQEEWIFEEAAQIKSDAERAAYLEKACRGDSELRARLEVLLEGHFKAQGFLEGESGQAAGPAGTLRVISCEIDGIAVQNLERYRDQSPAVPMVLPENNMVGLPPGQYGMMVDDGYYLVLAPLSVGTHTIHWISTMVLIPYWDPWQDPPAPPYPQVGQEVTYHIAVVPGR
jgi:hypothetical protein